jgi:hypothetical protein
MFIDVDAKPGDAVITDSGFVGIVSRIFFDKSRILYEVVDKYTADERGRNAQRETQVVFTQTWQYKDHVEKKERERTAVVMEIAKAVCDKFEMLRDEDKDGAS